MPGQVIDGQLVDVPLKGTVGFTKKINLESRGGNKYESEELSIFLPFEIEDGATQEQIEDEIDAAATLAKVHVLTQLGLTPGSNPETGVITEEQAVANVQKAMPGTKKAGPRKPAPKRRAAKKQEAPDPDEPSDLDDIDVPDECEKCGGTSFYDNRQKKADGAYKPNAPDFKCKDCNKGIWLR